MTVKVKGRKKYRETCNGCSSILQFKKSDVRHKAIEDEDGFTSLLKYIKCPQCKMKVQVTHIGL